MPSPRKSSRERLTEAKEVVTWTMIKAAMYIVMPFIPLALWLTRNTSEDIARGEKEAREHFFDDHPELELYRWKIPVGRYHPEVVVEIVDEISILLDVQTERSETPPLYFEFSETGELTADQEERVAEEDMHYHLAIILQRWLIEEVTEEYTYDLDTAEKFCRWLVAAVAVKPDLLADYTGTLISDHPHPSKLRFTPKKKWRADRMHGWK